MAYTDDEYIKKHILDLISVLNLENQKLLKMVENVPASRHIIQQKGVFRQLALIFSLI